MLRMKGTVILKTDGEGIVRVVEDTTTGIYSVGLRTKTMIDWKPISKELHDLMVKELSLERSEGND